MTDIRSINLDALNSATKYPSIPTYHALDPKNGSLLEQPTEFTGDVILTEKVDGSNGRIIQLPGGDWVIGSREELLFARGDLIGNPAQGIASALRGLAASMWAPVDHIRVMYLEVYGGKIGAAAREYTGTRQVGYLMFDAATIPLEVLDWPRERISAWRDQGGQQFIDETALADLAGLADDEWLEVTPRLATVNGAELPTDIDGMHKFLNQYAPESLAALDPDAGRTPEGIVLRTADRSVIAKARFQDYQRTAKRRAQADRSR
jgi:hypothetical protein